LHTFISDPSGNLNKSFLWVVEKVVCRYRLGSGGRISPFHFRPSNTDKLISQPANRSDLIPGAADLGFSVPVHVNQILNGLATILLGQFGPFIG
jgi:hypothetical protein